MDNHHCETIFEASINGHHQCIITLLNGCMNVDEKDFNGLTALQLAYQSGHSNCVRLLLDHGANVNETRIDGYIYGGEQDQRYTLIHFACYEGHIESVKLLLNYGANVNARSDHGITPLHLAAGNNNTEIVQLLLDHGADINRRTHNDKHLGYTPLLAASNESNYESMKLLLEYGHHCPQFDVNQKSCHGATALHYSCRNRNYECIKLLLNHGADINIKNGAGWTPFHTLVANFYPYGGHRKIISVDVNPQFVELLVDNGADIYAPTNEGQTVLDVANEEMKHFIKEYSEDVVKEPESI
jgi:ankyrin repeat protein